MKILFMNAADIEGGAAKAATRLLNGVHKQGAETRLYVQRKFGNDALVDGPRPGIGKALGFARPTIEQHLFGICPRKVNGPFSVAFLPDGLNAQLNSMAPDIVHLHWVARMMRLESLRRFNTPIVWTMHDSWAFTGGCYLPLDCTRYRESCGKCPVLNSPREDDLSERVWRRKQKAWKGLNLTVVAPSRWMAACARASSLFRDTRVEVIPNGLDITTYTPCYKRTSREIFSLPHNKKLVLFGAKSATEDRNKGFHLLTEAVRELATTTRQESIELVVFGTAEPDRLAGLGLKAHYLGWQHDDIKLAQLYSAADVMVLPSIQENLPYAVMEAMSCGTPCVAFNQGGVPDLIDHEHNGYLARPFEPADLARGIAWVLEDEKKWDELSFQARLKVEQELSFEKIAERHIALYREILKHD
jgi:glycosyltransferase involved in cell wall biosynthesis